jgi:hypothetical protein
MESPETIHKSRELDELRARLAEFERRYLLQVGKLYAEMDMWEAVGAEFECRGGPSDAARAHAKQALEQALDTYSAVHCEFGSPGSAVARFAEVEAELAALRESDIGLLYQQAAEWERKNGQDFLAELAARVVSNLSIRSSREVGTPATKYEMAILRARLAGALGQLTKDEQAAIKEQIGEFIAGQFRVMARQRPDLLKSRACVIARGWRDWQDAQRESADRREKISEEEYEKQLRESGPEVILNKL